MMKEFTDLKKQYALIVLFLTFILNGCTLHAKYGDEDEEEIISDKPVAAAIARDPTNTDPFLASLPADPYLAVINKPLTPEYTQLYKDAKAALKAGDDTGDAKAESMFRKLIVLNPEPSMPYLQLALLYKKQNKLDAAFEFADKARQANQYNYAARNLLGIICREQGKFSDAEKHYQNILALWQGYPEAHLNLGILYDLYMGKYAEAGKQYQMYLSLIRADEKEAKKVESWLKDLTRRMQSAPQ